MRATSGSPCRGCQARRRLIEELSPLLDYNRGRPERLLDLLELDSEQLIEAVGGRRRGELHAGLNAAPAAHAPPRGCWETCPHGDSYPPRALDLANPPLLTLRGRRGESGVVLGAPAVAFVGTRAPSSYGMEMTGALARGLAAAGVTVLGGLEGTIGRCALTGALRGRGHGVAVSGHGLAVTPGGSARPLLGELLAHGLVLSEQAATARGRSWGVLAAERLVVALADAVVLVEARAEGADMLGAGLARRLGRPLAALPGLLTNPLAGGPLQELCAGALLVRGAEDLLDLLHVEAPASRAAGPPLRGELAGLLERVGAGMDTVAALCERHGSMAATLAGLGELEAMGLVRRLPGGRYQALEPLAGRPPHTGGGEGRPSAG